MEARHFDSDYKIPVPTLDGFEMVDYSLIIYCKAESSQSAVYSYERKGYLIVCLTLKQLEKMLAPHGYYRIHKSYLINTGHFKHYTRGRDGKVLMDNGDTLPVSRTYKKGFVEKYRGMWE